MTVHTEPEKTEGKPVKGRWAQALAKEQQESKHDAWMDEMDKLLWDFVQNDMELGEFLLDGCKWDGAFYAGLTPAKALANAIERLKSYGIPKWR
jgi:hypothetical protein